MKSASRVLLLVCVLLLAAGTGLALDVPPAPTRWVTDAAGIIPPDQLMALDQKLEAFEKRSGTQFIIYTFPSLENESLEEFTIRAATKWRVGQEKYDNGLILFVFQKERKVRVEVGYGREGAVTDALSSRAIREYLAPHFQRGDYGAGLNAAADFLISTVEKTEPPVPVAQASPARPMNEGTIRLLMILAFIFFFFILPSLSRRRRGCGGCFIPMFPMGGGGFTMGGGGFGGGGFGGGGFSGGGGGFGGGGASGGW